MTEEQSSRILLVEDDPERCVWFNRKLSSHQIDCTADVLQAIQWLSTHHYDTIFLDHDLITEHYTSNAPDDTRTGYAVAAWLASHPHLQRDATIVIHSLNFVGAGRMLDLLHDAGLDAEHIPFPLLQTGLKY